MLLIVCIMSWDPELGGGLLGVEVGWGYCNATNRAYAIKGLYAQRVGGVCGWYHNAANSVHILMGHWFQVLGCCRNVSDDAHPRIGP